MSLIFKSKQKKYILIFYLKLILLLLYLGKNSTQAVIVDMSLLEGLDDIKLKKEYEYLNFVDGSLLLQSGLIPNICNYPISDLSKNKFTYPTEEFVSHLFTTSGSDLSSFLRISPLASHIAPFLTISSVTSILKILKKYKQEDDSKLVSELIKAISDDIDFKKKIELGQLKIKKAQDELDICLKSFHPDDGIQCEVTTEKLEIIERLSPVLSECFKNHLCLDQKNQLEFITKRWSYDKNYLKSFVNKLSKSFKSELKEDSKYPKHFTEQILISLSLLLVDEEESYPIVKKRKLQYIYKDLDIIDDIKRSKGQFPYNKESYLRLTSNQEFNHLNIDENKALYTFLSLGEKIYDTNPIPEIGSKTVEYQMKDGRKVFFPDCMDSSILNFYTILFMSNNGIIDIPLLKKIKAKPSLIQFFKNHLTVADLLSSQTAHNEFANIIEEIPDVEYVGNKGYEVETKIKNIFVLTDVLFFSEEKDKKLSREKNSKDKLDKLCQYFSREGFNLDWENSNGNKNSIEERDKILFKINGENAFTWNMKEEHCEIQRVREEEEKVWKSKVLSRLKEQKDEGKYLLNTKTKIKKLLSPKGEVSTDRLIQALHNLESTHDYLNLLYSMLISEKSDSKYFDQSIGRLLSKIPTDYYSQLGLFEILFVNKEKFEEKIDSMLEVPPLKGYLEKLLITVASKGNLKALKYLIEKKGVDPKAESNEAFIAAASNGHLEILKYLMEKRVNPSDKNNSAFLSAATNGHLNVLKYLIEKKIIITSVKVDSFLWAVTNGHIDVLEYLITLGVNPAVNGNAAFINAARYGQIKVLEFLIEKGIDPASENSEVFRVASRSGQMDVVKFLLKLDKIDPYADDGKVINGAIETKNKELLEIILKCGKVKSSDKERINKILQN